MTQKRRAGRPRTYDDAQGMMTKAALSPFAQKGFEATSVGDISKAADLPKANVRYYFGGKEKLWKHAIDRQ